MARMMRLPLVCAILLASASWSFCSDSEEEMKALEADLLTNMYTSKNHVVVKLEGSYKTIKSNPLLHQGIRIKDYLPLAYFYPSLKSNWIMSPLTAKSFPTVNKAKFPQWKMTLLNICDLVTNLNNEEEAASDAEEEDLMTRRPFPAAFDSFTLEAMLTLYQLQKVCQSRTFQHWELLQQDIYDPENSSQDKDLMKRKTPYILKRQVHVNKARRPYILKRSSYY